MYKQNILYGIIGLLAGFIIGFFFANSVNRNAALQVSTQQTLSNTSPSGQIQSAASIKNSTNGAMMPQVSQAIERAQNEPDNFEAQIAAGEMFLRIQNTEKAGEFFQRAARAQQGRFEEFVTLGNAFFDIRRFEEAEKWYTQALEKNPDDVNVRTDLGSTFMERQEPDLDRAIKEYRTSLLKDPKHESTLYNLSLAQMRKGDSQAAQETLNRLENINSNSPLIPKLKEKLNQPTAR